MVVIALVPGMLHSQANLHAGFRVDKASMMALEDNSNMYLRKQERIK